MWLLYALLSAGFAALIALLAKVGVRGVDSHVATAVRTTVVLVLAWGLVALQGNLSLVTGLSRTSLWFLVFSGAATGISWLFYFRALQLGPVSLVSAVDKLSLAFVLLFAVLLFKEPLSLRAAVGCGLILLGTALVVWP
ncbi:MAG: EamA family transporter [Opitutaceae bacterium]